MDYKPAWAVVNGKGGGIENMIELIFVDKYRAIEYMEELKRKPFNYNSYTIIELTLDVEE